MNDNNKLIELETVDSVYSRQLSLLLLEGQEISSSLQATG